MPDYTNSGLNAVSSIASYFHCPLPHPTLPFLDRELQKGYRSVVLMLFDGMGMDLLSHALPEDSFLRTHAAHALSAVYPSTTTNATTCIECGVSPREGGWLGWTLYFPQIEKPVDVFTNLSNGEPAADYPVADRYIPRQMLFPRINEAGDAHACIVSRYGDVKIDSLDGLFSTTLSLLRDERRHYIYAYWHDPDHTMHEMGCYHPQVLDAVREIDRRVAQFASEMPADTLLLVTADHGLVDAEFHYLAEEAPELLAMLKHQPTMEARAVSFHVKPECVRDFPAAFARHFGGHFLLITGDAFIRDYLGDGPIRPCVYDFVGDYMALATDAWCIQDHRRDSELKGVHAGLTEQEMLVPLVVAGREK